MRNDSLKEASYSLFLKSLIAVLCFVILLFYLFPDHRLKQTPVQEIIQEPFLTLEDLPPPTRQNRPPSPNKRVQLPSLFIPIPSETEDLPDSLSLPTFPAETGKEVNISPVFREIPPRPVLEIYPNTKKISCKGEIQLYILIDMNGKVAEVEVLKNTTNNSECLRKTLQAVKKTRWLPGRRNGQPESMWVKKTFRFQ